MSAVLAQPRSLAWRIAMVAELVRETHEAVTIVFDIPDWPGHVAGQHVDIRLTAPDGYQTQRSYSISSGPEEGRLAITVERIDDGEVSPYLTQVLIEGDEIELRGPIGGHFTWRVEDGGPLLLVAGGSGLAPLMSMLRHRAARSSEVDTRLLVSARTRADLLYAGELADGPGLMIHRTLTRERPDGWDGYDRRVDRAMLEEVGPAPSERPRVFVCGPTGFVEQVADVLVDVGHDPAAIHAERFGPTG
ncbi:MAG TPA: ferredoxin reductase [Solirubrobacteraceae bacterium]|nr:ferredoxin reductase [Solirubrobacteraceae bacterium]